MMDNCIHDPITFGHWRSYAKEYGVCIRCSEIVDRHRIWPAVWCVSDAQTILRLARHWPDVYDEMRMDQKHIRELLTSIVIPSVRQFRVRIAS